MTERVDPLGKGKVVEEDGTPTNFFARQWQSLISVAREAAQAATDALEAIEAANTVANRTITAGTDLTGGGDLTADRTIDHEDSGVSAGTYGDATNSPQITVNARGHVTDVTEVPISGGGGGGGGVNSFHLDNFDSSNSGSFDAFKGVAFTPQVNVTISRIFAAFVPVNGGTYQAHLCTLDGSNAITAIVSSATWVSAGTEKLVRYFDITPTALTAGTKYAILVGRTDGGDTYRFPIASGDAQDFGQFPSVGRFDAAKIPDAAPAVSDTIEDGFSTSTFGIGLHWAFS